VVDFLTLLPFVFPLAILPNYILPALSCLATGFHLGFVFSPCGIGVLASSYITVPDGVLSCSAFWRSPFKASGFSFHPFISLSSCIVSIVSPLAYPSEIVKGFHNYFSVFRFSVPDPVSPPSSLPSHLESSFFICSTISPVLRNFDFDGDNLSLSALVSPSRSFRLHSDSCYPDITSFFFPPPHPSEKSFWGHVPFHVSTFNS